VLTAYAPAGILIIAWDMARFLNMTCPIAIFMLLSLLTAERRGGKASS
jgi:hypothetical protein